MTKFHRNVYHCAIYFLVLTSHIVNGNGEASDAKDRVIGGHKCSTEEHGFMVLLMKKRGFTTYRICGGSLFRPGWVLTAAHCIETSPKLTYSILIAANTFKKTILVQKYYVHPKYDEYDSHVNDVAVLKLTSRLDSDFRSGNIKYVALPKLEDPDTDPRCKYGLIMGWGKTDSNKVAEVSNLQCGVVELIPSQQCYDKFYSHDHTRIHRSQMCTVSDEGIEAYLGDSGGPLMCDDVQVGIVSWGMGKHTPFPAVFTRVRDHLDFINEDRGEVSGACTLESILFAAIFVLYNLF